MLPIFSLSHFYDSQALAAIPFFNYGFGAISLVFMLLYVWSREFPNATINMYGLFTLKVSGNLQVLLSYIVSLLAHCALLNNCLLYFPWSVGILLALDDACTGCYFRFTYLARLSWHCCWTPFLLLDRTSSSRWWKEYSQDSGVGVSFLKQFFLRFEFSCFPGSC